MTIIDYLIEFDRMIARLKEHSIQLPEPVLARRVLKSANLSEEKVYQMGINFPEVSRCFNKTLMQASLKPARSTS